MTSASVDDAGVSLKSAALSSRLPADLSLSISRVLAPAHSHSQPRRSPSATAVSVSAYVQNRSHHDEAPSITTQLAALFPSVDDLSPSSIAQRQAHIRQELAKQEQHIETLLVQLLRRQAALQEHANAEARGSNQSSKPLSSKDLDEKVGILLQQLDTIRAKAHKSEEIVREITRDIRMLDTCKRNVVNSMTALKRLQMLVNAVAQLDRLTKASRFREAASSLSAVQSLLSSFEGYAGVERVATIQRDVGALQQELGQKARAEFESYFTQEAARPVRSTAVPDAALVIDALGADARTSLIDFYTTFQLREYRRIFRATDEAGQLDNVARRFAWFRRILKMYDEDHAAVFEDGPSMKRWNVARELTRKFTEVTRQDIRSVLIRTQGKLQVPVLLEALSASLEFEKTISRRFGMPFAELSTASSSSPTTPPSAGTHSTSQPPPLTQATTLSSAFDPYLGLFVDAQDRALADMIQNFRQQGSRQSMDDGAVEGARDGPQHTVLPSSTELFYFYGSVLEQCGRLSTREPFRDLCVVYKKHLLAYAEDILRPLLQRHEYASRRSAETRSNHADLQRLCMVINTADYCATTSKQLEGKLKERIDVDFSDSVDLEQEREIFLAVISAGVQGLARELELSADVAFQKMLRTPWSELETTDIKSAYVDELAGALEHVSVVVRQDVQSKRYVRNWCDKVVGVVLARYMFNIVKLKPVTKAAAQQMLTDLADVRALLLELPRYSLSDEGSTSAASSYNRYVSKGVSHIETLLKLIAAPDDSAETLVDTYTRLVGDRSFSNFQKILDLKGIRKGDQNTLMDAFVGKVSQDDTLEDSSFLTGLDMDTTSASAAALSSISMSEPTSSMGGAAAGLLSFMGGSVASDGAGSSTPPLGSTPRYAASLGLGGLGLSSASPGTGGRSGKPTAQTALSDLRRFGSMLVGRREASSEARGR